MFFLFFRRALPLLLKKPLFFSPLKRKNRQNDFYKMEALLFFLTTLGTFAAFLVINTRNPVHSVLFLIFVFFNTSGILLTMGLDFFAMIFLVVYVGAIAVLFLFVVMMLNIKLSEFYEKKLRYLPLGGLLGFFFLLQILYVLEKETTPLLSNIHFFEIWKKDIYAMTNMESLGYILYTHSSFHFILASLILFVAMLGAIVLTMEKTVFLKRQQILQQNYREFTKTVQRIE